MARNWVPCLLSIIFLLAWWTFAFSFKTPISINYSEPNAAPLNPAPSPGFTLNFNCIKEALTGNCLEMIKLLALWDAEASHLVNHNHRFQWLDRETIEQAVVCYRQISKQGLEEQPPPQYLPQTYASASILLALVPDRHIAALPCGMRKENHLFNREFLKKIKLDIRSENAEKIQQKNPVKAFIAPYSNPDAIQALSNRGIKLIMTNSSGNFAEIMENIQTIGLHVQQREKSELLVIFMKACLLAIKADLDQHLPQMKNKKILVLNHALQFSEPSSASLLGSMLRHLGIQVDEINKTTKIIEIPRIIELNPEIMIIYSTDPEKAQQALSRDYRLCNIDAVKKNKFLSLDYRLQQDPSQAAVLAYFQLAEALKKCMAEVQ